jgi:hypothetical protein
MWPCNGVSEVDVDSENGNPRFVIGLAPILSRHVATTAELADVRACRGQGAEKVREETVIC